MPLDPNMPVQVLTYRLKQEWRSVVVQLFGATPAPVGEGASEVSANEDLLRSIKGLLPGIDALEGPQSISLWQSIFFTVQAAKPTTQDERLTWRELREQAEHA